MIKRHRVPDAVVLLVAGWLGAVGLAVAEETPADPMALADQWYEQRETPGAIDKAVALYQQALEQDPNNHEALWRLARSCWWQGDHAAKDNVAIFIRGQEAAHKAAEIRPGATEGHYWYGVNMGRAAEARGILDSLFSVDPIRKAMETVLAIDPTHSGACHVLGVLYRKAPGWPLSLGNLDTSLRYARKAVEFSPDEVLPRIGLAETLHAKGKRDEARQVLEEALTRPGLPDRQPETRMDKTWARNLLATWK